MLQTNNMKNVGLGWLSRALLAAVAVAGPLTISAQAQFAPMQPLVFVKPFGGANPLPQILSIASTGANFTFTAAASTSSGGSWLSASPSGLCCTTPSHVSAIVNAVTTLAVGSYSGQITFSGGTGGTLTVPVTLIVAPVTRAYFGDIPGHLSFSMKPGGRPPSKVISIPNGGIGTLTWTLTTTTFNGANFLTVSATSGTAPSVLTVGVNTANLPSGGAVAGTYTGQIQLLGAGDTVTIPVSIYVGATEFEQINPLNFVKVFGGVDPLSQVITGATTGTAFTFTVSLSVGQGGTWLAVSPVGLCCTTPDAITVTVNPAVSLAVGTYTGHVNLTTASRAMTVPVTLTIVPAGSTYFDNLPGQLSFSFPTTTTVPAGQVLDLRKVGSGALDWTLTATTFDTGAWLNVSPLTGTAPALVPVGITPGNLPGGGTTAGVFLGHLLFESALTGSRITVPVAVTVGQGFAQTSGLFFTMALAGANPLPQTINLASTGANFTYTVAFETATGGNWLTVSPTGLCCTTPDTLTATINAPAGLAAGSYTGQIIVKGASPAITIPVTLTVAAAGAVFLDNLPGQLSFTAKLGGTFAPQTFQIRNRGTGSLNWTLTPSTFDGGNWLQVSAVSGTTPATVTVNVIAANLPTGGLLTGAYSAHLLVQAIGSAVTIPVSVELKANAIGQIPALQFTMPLAGANPLPQYITAISAGANFNFTVTPSTANGGSWLKVSPIGLCCTTPRAIRASIEAPAGLAAGSYTGQIVIQGTTSITVPVTLTVAPLASAFFDNAPGQLYYSMNTGGPSPPTQSVQIRNRGTGTLNWTAAANTFDNGGWLSISSASGAAPSEVTISVNAAKLPNAGLVAGVFTGQVAFTSSGAIPDSALTVPITVTVGGNTPAQINGLHFTMPLAGANPLPQNITMTSLGTNFNITANSYTGNGGDWLNLSPIGLCCTTPTVFNAAVAAPTGLAAGTYTGQIDLATNTVTQTVPLTLTVAAAGTPFFDNTQGQLSFSGLTSSGGFTDQTVQIRNRGSGALNWTLTPMTFDGGNWLTVSAASGTAPSTITVAVTKANLPLGGLVDGLFTGQILIDGGASRTTVPVSVHMGNPAFVQRNGLTFTMNFGGQNPLSQVFSAASTGTGFTFTSTAQAGNGGNWLTVAPVGLCCNTPRDMTLAVVNGAAVPAGTYTGQAVMTRAGSALTVPVTLIVVGSTALTSISVSAASSSIAPGTTQQFTATGTYSDGSTQNITAQVTWASSNAAIATIGASTGFASGVAGGTANITASLGGITSNTFPLSVGVCTFQTSGGIVYSPALGSSNQIAITTQTGCAWTAISANSWLVASPPSGTGSGTVTLTAAANTGAARSSAATIAGQKTVVAQAGTGANTPPGTENIFPSSGTALTQTFAATYSDANGVSDLASVYLLVNAGLGATNACYVEHTRASGEFRLLSDTADKWLGPGLAGASTVLQNTQCSVNMATSSASVAGNTLTVNMAIAFKAGFAGRRALFLTATDNSGATSDWSILGNWWPGAGAGSIVNRYRIFNKSSNTHIHTTDLNEYNTLILNTAVFNNEGVGSRIYDTQAAVNGISAVPYYRIYITAGRSHFWTTDRNEYLTLIKFRGAYSGEGVDGFILPSQTGTAVALRRLNFCPASACPQPIPIHHWTTDQNEFNVLTAGGAWQNEGIAGYVYNPAGPAPSPEPGNPVLETATVSAGAASESGDTEPDGPVIKAIVHGAYPLVTPMAAGQRVRIWGRRFGPNAEVRFDGVKARVVSASDWEIQAIVPDEAAAQSKGRVTVIAGGVASSAYEAVIAAASPGVSVTDAYGKGVISGYRNGKAERGEAVTVRFTGRGASDVPVVIRIGGVRAEIIGIDAAEDAPGYFDARVLAPGNPALLDGLARVSITIGEAFSQTGVLLPMVE